MSLQTDRRGRVPFALIGVLLVVTASVYATGLANRETPTVERPAVKSVDATERDVRPALRTAVREAARDAARNPVTDPAETPTGRVLNESSPFVDSLRVRIAVAARRSLADVERKQSDIRTSVSLPEISGATNLRRAKRDVTVTAVDDGEALTARIRNITVRAHRDGRVVTERRLNVTLTVRTPVLALHDRATTYEQRLNRGPLVGPGLGRSLTTRLYPVTMARGYARYAGAPIRNVLGNRHVGLSTNTALLAQQRAVFGQHDQDSARAVELATVRVGVTDILGPQSSGAATLAEWVLRPNAVDDETDDVSGHFAPQAPDAPPISSSPGAAADEAYLGLQGDLEAVTAKSYRVDAVLQTRVINQNVGGPPASNPPGEDWFLLSERTSDRTEVNTVGDPGPDGNRTPGTADPTVHAMRQVIIHHTTTRVWLRGGETRTTTMDWREESRVELTVRTEYAPGSIAPDRPTKPLFHRGGVIDGPNLAGSQDRAVRALLAANGGIDAIARDVAAGETESLEQNKSIIAERPQALGRWIGADLRSLRQAVANVSVNVSRRRLAAGDANPAALLAEKLRNRRAVLVDAPIEYDGAADRARVAARAAYLDRVIEALERREAATKAQNREYRDTVGDGAARRLANLVRVGSGGSEQSGSYTDGPTQGGETDELRITPVVSPAYLTQSAVDHDHVPTVAPGETVHPLVVETKNWFTLPYGEAADTIVGTLFGRKRVTLGTASETLVAANQTLEAGKQDTSQHETGQSTAAGKRSKRKATLAENRAALARAVGRSVQRIEGSVCVAARNGTSLSAEVCGATVQDLRDRWPTLGHRGLAMSNGSYADAFIAALEARGVDSATATDTGIRVRVHLREVTGQRRTAVPAETTNETATATTVFAREELRRTTESALEDSSKRATRKLTGASRLPAGLPLAPPPYTWVATVNAWSVTVRGEYQRFALRTPGGSPDGGGGVVRYIRDGSAARLDVDGDGEPERLGQNERVSFETETTVVAAVPPGPPGVGDVDGERTERSPGWPCPGADDAESCTIAFGGE